MLNYVTSTSKPHTNRQAQMLADRIATKHQDDSPNDDSSRNLSADTWIQLATVLIPILIRCFNPSDGEEARQYVLKRRQDKRLRKAVARRVQEAGRTFGRLVTFTQGRMVARRVIDQICDDTNENISLCIREFDKVLPLSAGCQDINWAALMAGSQAGRGIDQAPSVPHTDARIGG